MDEITKKILKDVCHGINYQKIILFGSRARNEASDKSDYDIMIILNDPISIKEKIRLSTRLRWALAKKSIDADIVIKSVSEMESDKGKVGSLVRNVLRDGVIL